MIFRRQRSEARAHDKQKSKSRESRSGENSSGKEYGNESSRKQRKQSSKRSEELKEGSSRKQRGARGEQLAALHLTHLGWEILQRNFRSAQGEIDIIAHETTATGKVLVFVEVKTRYGQTCGTPSEAVDLRKQHKLLAVAQSYLGALQAGGVEPACRFDVAEVRVDANDFSSIVLRRAFFMEE